MLVDPETMTKAPDCWTCSRVEFEGLPGSAAPKEGDKDAADAAAAAAAWPKGDELAALLNTRLGRVVTTAEVEADVAALEATGLFARVRPLCEPPRRGDAPLLAAVRPEGREGLELEYVPPLGCTRFIVEPRVLPPVKSMSVRLDSSLKARALGAGRGTHRPHTSPLRAHAQAADPLPPPATPRTAA